MHIHYTAADKSVNEAKALRDCKDYLGGKFYTAKALLKKQADMNERTTNKYRSIAMALDFAGIRGYWPVRAMVREVLK
jgi:hypothetical protein